MLNRPDDNTIRAFAALTGNQNFETILEWMRASLKTLDTANRVTRDEILTRWNQGGSQVITDFLSLAEGSKATSSRL